MNGAPGRAAFRAPVAPLFVPGDRPDRFDKAWHSGADAIILDLEDAVAAPHKALARTHVQQWCASAGASLLDDAAPSVIVRINARSTSWFAADLQAMQGLRLAAVMLPKVEKASDVAAIHAAMGHADTPVIALVESAMALNDLGGLLCAPGVCLAAFGALDLALDLGCQANWEPLLMARSSLVLHARLAGLPAPLDGVATGIDDMAAVEAEARRAADMGFGGKLAIHPRQLAPIRRAFQPEAAAIAWAQRVLAAVDTDSVTDSRHRGALRIDGAMVDLPLITRARRILLQGDLLG